MLLDDLVLAAGGDVRKLRAMLYDFQTIVGAFLPSIKEREQYIEGKGVA